MCLTCCCSILSYSLRPHGQYSLWNSPGQNTGVATHSLLQRLFPTQGWTPGLLLCRRVLHPLSHQGSPPLLSTPGHFSGGKINSSFPNLLPFRDKLPNTPISALHSSSLLGTDANSAKASALTLLCVLSSQRMAWCIHSLFPRDSSFPLLFMDFLVTSPLAPPSEKQKAHSH